MLRVNQGYEFLMYGFFTTCTGAVNIAFLLIPNLHFYLYLVSKTARM